MKIGREWRTLPIGLETKNFASPALSSADEIKPVECESVLIYSGTHIEQAR
jgi:hypothetical protein